MSSLHRVRGRNRFCAPTAISAVLGISTDEAAGALRPVRYEPRRLAAAEAAGRPPLPVKGIDDIELITTLNNLGCRLEVTVRPDRPTLRTWINERPEDIANHILLVRRHYIACNPAARTIVDRIFAGRRELQLRRGPGRDLGRMSRSLDAFPHELRQRVKQSFRIVPVR